MGSDRTEAEGLPQCSSCGHEIHRDDARDFMGGQTRHRSRGRCIELIRVEQSAIIERLQAWVNDLQSGMYINCVYCGHRYGPSDDVPASMADVLKEHVEQCPEHPMSALQQRVDELESKNALLRDGLAQVGDFAKARLRTALDTDKGDSGG